ncbi:MAG: antibiotic ABC transporter permease [Haloferacaceae archaeon]
MSLEAPTRRRDGEYTSDRTSDRALFSTLRATLAYAREREYTGWDYGDGMSSRLLQAVPLDSRLLNLVVQETIKRSPVNLRPLFLVEQRRNHKGAALFAMANRTVDELAPAVDADPEPVDYRAETRTLLDWLLEQDAGGYRGFCVGHQHPIQDLQGLAERNEPDAVCTSYAVKALLRAADLDPAYPSAARTAAEFVVDELDYRPTDHGARITYSGNHDGSYYTLNAGALAARLFVDLYDHFGTDEFRRRATELLDHIDAKQEPNGGWQYRDPPSASHLSMDTHHNGFILETFQRYADVVATSRYADAVERSLRFHRETLFRDDGAPNFDESSAYPRDIHASAQGVLVFSYAGDFERARRVIEWTLDNLYAGDGRFHFRKHRLFTNRVTLMRWCQAWMAYAIAEYLAARHLRT